MRFVGRSFQQNVWSRGRGESPSKRSWSEDEPSTNGLDPSVLTSASTIPQPATTKTTVIYPMNKSSLHDSGLKPEYLPVCENYPITKLYISVVSIVVIMLRVELPSVPIFIRSIYTLCWGVPIVSIMFGLLMHGPNTFALIILVFPCLWKWSWSEWGIWGIFGSFTASQSIRCSIYFYLIKLLYKCLLMNNNLLTLMHSGRPWQDNYGYIQLNRTFNVFI